MGRKDDARLTVYFTDSRVFDRVRELANQSGVSYSEAAVYLMIRGLWAVHEEYQSTGKMPRAKTGLYPDRPVSEGEPT